MVPLPERSHENPESITVAQTPPLRWQKRALTPKPQTLNPGSRRFEPTAGERVVCSGSEVGAYLRLIDIVYHSTLGLRVIKQRRRERVVTPSPSILQSEAAPFPEGKLLDGRRDASPTRYSRDLLACLSGKALNSVRLRL